MTTVIRQAHRLFLRLRAGGLLSLGCCLRDTTLLLARLGGRLGRGCLVRLGGCFRLRLGLFGLRLIGLRLHGLLGLNCLLRLIGRLLGGRGVLRRQSGAN